MSGIDGDRLRELEKLQQTLQYGTGFQVAPFTPGDLVLVAANLVRFEGKKTDLNAWRIYLKPWQPAPGQGGGGFVGQPYASPTPWVQTGTPAIYDNFFDDAIFARVAWGSGGVQHQAFVDWPKRGKLFQVSGSYLQVDAVGTGISVFGPPPLNAGHPFLEATLAIEPGGGDSSLPGTFTYRRQPSLTDPDADPVWLFQIPPFARTFRLLLDGAGIQLAGAGTTVQIQEVSTPTGQILQSFLWAPLAADIQQDDIQLTRGGSDIRVTMISPTGIPQVDQVGLLFSLDL